MREITRTVEIRTIKEARQVSLKFFRGESLVVTVCKSVNSLQIRHLVSSMCIDSAGKPEDLHQPVGLYPCHRQGGNQVHEFRIRENERVWNNHRGTRCYNCLFHFILIIVRVSDSNLQGVLFFSFFFFFVFWILDGDGIFVNLLARSMFVEYVRGEI